MAKTISVDDLTYSNVVTVAGKMMMMFGKPLSLGATIWAGMQTLDRVLETMTPERIQRAKEALKNLSSPEEFDKVLEKAFKEITGEKPQKA